jgi:phosphatidylserine decarboxylase
VSDAPGIGTRLFVGLQYLLPQRLLSRLIGRIARARCGWVRVPLTRWFVRTYRPELGDAGRPDPLAYASFNEFFTRALRPGARPLPDEPAAIVSPADGVISACGQCERGRILQAKGRDYTLLALLAGDASLEARFRDGSFMTIYLAPFNYHRVHAPLAGKLAAAWYVPGRLFSVNDATASMVPGLFARNERVILEFEGKHGGFIVILVGALFVGSMSTVWHGEVAPGRARGIVPLPVDVAGALLERGAELGRFNMGSTVIVLLPPGAGGWDADMGPARSLRVGQRIGLLAPPR